MKKIFILVFALAHFTMVHAQSLVTKNLIVVVLDGMRWQEVFAGADSSLINNFVYTRNQQRTKGKFWDMDPHKRREKLFPFLWNTVATSGQLYGNRHLQNNVNVSNPFQLTYPGFSEMLTGYVDPAIRSNRLLTSKSQNVLEFINKQKGFGGSVSVFATSDLFPFLLDRKNSKLYINSDSDSLEFDSEEFHLINEMQRLTAKPTTERPDLLTYFSAREYLKRYRPRVIYLALGETDAFAHDGNYDQYLETAHTEDKMISELWNLVQAIPQYTNKTTLIITCDHGRGNLIKEQWTSHGPEIKDSGEIWIAAMGPDTPATGEVKRAQNIYQGQLASTMASILGFDFNAESHQAMPPVTAIFTRKK